MQHPDPDHRTVVPPSIPPTQGPPVGSAPTQGTPPAAVRSIGPYALRGELGRGGMGRRKEAVAALEQALKLKPDHPQAKAIRALISSLREKR